ncbi:hypothetical protein CD116_00295 [Staphylococcus schweitzeri]|uniref:Uncharacterized protein n=1 Tax=Staphylococcus schweitzeri TaxID=1654388 RepID=A0A2K4APX0_9STAP|nr:hypothetical protein CD116_00295 [Staphylococcus schweitzeri]
MSTSKFFSFNHLIFYQYRDHNANKNRTLFFMHSKRKIIFTNVLKRFKNPLNKLFIVFSSRLQYTNLTYNNVFRTK